MEHTDFIRSIGETPATFDGPADAFLVLSRARQGMYRVWEEAFKRDEAGNRICQLTPEAEQVVRNPYGTVQEIDFFLVGIEVIDYHCDQCCPNGVMSAPCVHHVLKAALKVHHTMTAVKVPDTEELVWQIPEAISQEFQKIIAAFGDDL